MALSAKVTNVPKFLLNSGVKPPESYMMIAGYTPDRLRRNVRIMFVRFVDKAGFDKWRQMQEKMDALQVAMTDLQIKAVSAKTREAANVISTQLQSAQADYQAAAKEQADIPQEDDPENEMVGRENYADVLNDDGDVSVAKLYAHCHTLDRFKDAKAVREPGQKVA